MARLKLAQCFEVLVYVLRRRGRRVSGSVRRRLGLSHPLGNRKGFESLSDTCCVSLDGACKNEPRSASQSQSIFRIGLGGSRRRILRGVILFAGQSQSIFRCGTCGGDFNPDNVQTSRPKTQASKPQKSKLSTLLYFSLPYSTFCGFAGVETLATSSRFVNVYQCHGAPGYGPPPQRFPVLAMRVGSDREETPLGSEKGEGRARCYREEPPLGSEKGEGLFGAVDRRARWGQGRAKGGSMLSTGDPAGVREGRRAVRCYRQETPL